MDKMDRSTTDKEKRDLLVEFTCLNRTETTEAEISEVLRILNLQFSFLSAEIIAEW